MKAEFADKKSKAKWVRRSKRGVYVGLSQHHAGSVALIWNPETTHVSPQYHIVLDEGFTTCIPGSDEQNDEKYKTIFENLFKTE